VKLATIHLILFFTRGVSLRAWDLMGILEREVALYRRLQEHGIKVSFLTYGSRRDLAYRNHLPNISILCNRWGLPLRYYERWLLWLHFPHLLRATIFKTNQVKGGEIALRVARRLDKKLIARCGYLFSEVESQKYGQNSWEAKQAESTEARVFVNADCVAVTTPTMRQTVLARYQLREDKVVVVPNYVDTDLFKPNSSITPVPGRICFIGRLEEEKNLFALLEAVKGLSVELVIVGRGSLRETLETKAQTENIPARFLGNLPHSALPEVLNQSQLFILPSYYEGHPKTLLEAMACGLPVIGANSPGIRELIDHRQTGILCGTSPVEIRAAILEVLGDTNLRERISRQARQYVVKRFSLNRVVELELSLLKKVINDRS